MVFDKSLLDYSEEVVVKTGVYKENNDFGSTVPVFVDLDEAMDLRIWWTANARKRELTLGLEVERCELGSRSPSQQC